MAETITCPVCGQNLSPDTATCPTCGFKLLGSTAAFEPVAVDTEVAGERVQVSPQASLQIVRGPNVGTTFTLLDRPMSIGRSPKCDIFLNDMTVSREHAAIELKDGGYVISDNDSYNGIWINNESIESAPLKSGDIIQMGAFCLLYEE